MSIYRRADLDLQAQRSLERQQFNNVDDPRQVRWLEKLADYWTEAMSGYSDRDKAIILEAICINQEHVKLSHADVAKIYMATTSGLRTRHNVTPEVVETYISCICRYINARRRPPKPPDPDDMDLDPAPFPPAPPSPPPAKPVPQAGSFTLPSRTRARTTGLGRGKPVKTRPGGTAGPRGRPAATLRPASLRTRSRSPVSGNPRYGYRERDPIEPALGDKDKGPSCVMMGIDDFNRIKDLDQWKRYEEYPAIFQDLKIDEGRKFLELDYFFIPIHYDVFDHFCIAGIAPKQRFAFVLDSGMDHGEFGDFSNVLREIIGVGVKGTDNCEWPIYGQWSTRRATNDGSPDAAQQKDSYNCAMFTVTNTFCLAFGYDLLCFDQNDLDDLKRRRVVIELMNGGFGGELRLDYPLLDLPGNNYNLFDPKLKASEYYKLRNLNPPIVTASSGGVTGKGRGKPAPYTKELQLRFVTHPDPAPDPVPQVAQEDDFPEHNDDEEQLGFIPGSHIDRTKRSEFATMQKLATPNNYTPEEFDKALAKILNYKPCTKCTEPPKDPAEDSDGPDEVEAEAGGDSDIDMDENNTSPIPTSNQLYVAARKLLDGPDCPEKTKYLDKITETDRHPWPPQFSKQFHQKAGFIYSNPILPPQAASESSTGEAASRKILEDGCRKFPLRGVKDMKNRTRDGAREWAENEMNAFMARALVEVKTKPFPGLGRGYKKHKFSLDKSLHAANLGGYQ